MTISSNYYYFSLLTKKPVFRVCDQVRLKPACSARDKLVLKISRLPSTGIVLPRKRKTKVLNRLRGCVGWSASLLFVYGINRFYKAWLIKQQLTSFLVGIVRVSWSYRWSDQPTVQSRWRQRTLCDMCTQASFSGSKSARTIENILCLAKTKINANTYEWCIFIVKVGNFVSPPIFHSYDWG